MGPKIIVFRSNKSCPCFCKNGESKDLVAVQTVHRIEKFICAALFLVNENTVERSQ